MQQVINGSHFLVRSTAESQKTHTSCGSRSASPSNLRLACCRYPESTSIELRIAIDCMTLTWLSISQRFLLLSGQPVVCLEDTARLKSQASASCNGDKIQARFCVFAIGEPSFDSVCLHIIERLCFLPSSLTRNPCSARMPIAAGISDGLKSTGSAPRNATAVKAYLAQPLSIHSQVLRMRNLASHSG